MTKSVLVPSVLGFLVGTLVGALAFGDWGPHDRPTEAPVAPVAERPGPISPPAALTVGEQPSRAPEGPRQDPIAETTMPAATAPRGTDPRVETALAAWQSAEQRIADLQARLVKLERSIAGLEGAAAPERPQTPRTPNEKREALVTSGVDPGLAEDLLWREGRLELDKLNLRDLAVREGWVGSDRYRDELNRLTSEQRPLREEIGDLAWDRYLYNTGQDNRIAVSSVIQGSAAEVAGIQPGDLVESYDGERVFGFSELRDATTRGHSGDLVQIRVRRGGGTLDLWVPRGPLGVHMDMARSSPIP